MRITGSPADVAEVLSEEWTPLGRVTSKSMFGGVGLFCDGVMFTIIDKQGAVYLRSDETTDPIFEAGVGDVMGDLVELLSWGRRAVGVADANKKQPASSNECAYGSLYRAWMHTRRRKWGRTEPIT